MSCIPAPRASAKVRKTGGLVREKDDFYRTPPGSTAALLSVEQFSGPVWEPACGDGAMSAVLGAHGYEVVSTDLVDRGYGMSRRDFLLEQHLLAPNVVTRPPFKLADEFVLHALHLGAAKVCMFMRTGWVEGVARHQRLWLPFPPVRIWQFSSRQTLWRGDDPDARDSGGAIPFAWFVWLRGVREAPRLGWIP